MILVTDAKKKYQISRVTVAEKTYLPPNSHTQVKIKFNRNVDPNTHFIIESKHTRNKCLIGNTLVK